MNTRDQAVQVLGTLTQPELDAVVHVAATLVASRRPGERLDPAAYGPLYREFAAEDRALAEVGMADFERGLPADDWS